MPQAVNSLPSATAQHNQYNQAVAKPQGRAEVAGCVDVEAVGDRVDHGEFPQAAHHHPGDQGSEDVGQHRTERTGLTDGVAGRDEQSGADDTAEGDHHQMAPLHAALQACGLRGSVSHGSQPILTLMTHNHSDSLLSTLNSRPVILDGGLGTLLEDRGNDITGALWSAQILKDNPGEVRDAHADFFAAGAEVATACSYEVTVDGLVALGMSREDATAESERLLRDRKSVV